jgi:hypothetical protein
VLERAFELSPSSSIWNEAGLRPPPAVKSKSWGSSGIESCTITIRPRFWFVNVHVTTSSSLTSMLAGSEPSEHCADVRSHPLGVGPSARE